MITSSFFFFFFFFNDTATTEIYTLSLHDALPIYPARSFEDQGLEARRDWCTELETQHLGARSEEHTSELQSPCNLVCRLLLEKKKKTHKQHTNDLKYIIYCMVMQDVHTCRRSV